MTEMRGMFSGVVQGNRCNLSEGLFNIDGLV